MVRLLHRLPKFPRPRAQTERVDPRKAGGRKETRERYPLEIMPGFFALQPEVQFRTTLPNPFARNLPNRQPEARAGRADHVLVHAAIGNNMKFEKSGSYCDLLAIASERRQSQIEAASAKYLTPAIRVKRWAGPAAFSRQRRSRLS